MSEPNSAAEPSRSRAGGYAALVAAGILLSRLAGLVRTSVFAHYLGASRAADAFNVALKVPNFLQNLLGEGVLSASFIPVYARLLSKGDEKLAGRVAGVFASFLALLVSVVVLAGVLITPLILSITAAGLPPETMALAIKLTRIVFPGIGLLVLYAWSLGILNAHRQFFVSYVAPVLWNAAIIATLFIFGTRLRNDDLAVAVAWGTFAGCVLQFAVQIPWLMRYAGTLSFGFDRALEPVRTIFRNIPAVVGGRGVVQISGYVDQLIASFLATGSIANLVYAQTIYLAPISIFGMSVAAAELPQMASETGSDEEIRAALRRRLDRGIRQIAFFVVPTIVAFVLLGRLLVAALYQRGEFTADTTLVVWYILIGSTIGLLVATQARLYSSAYYALHDTRTPFRFAAVRVGIGAALGFLFAFPLQPMFATLLDFARLPKPAASDALGAVGITAATGIAAWIEFALLRRGLRHRIGAGESKSAYFAKLWIAAGAGGVAGLAIDYFFARRLPNVIEAIVVSTIFGVVYFAVAFALRVPEVRATLGRFTRR
ncbi:MAG TPA: murein biosynthesis integral membrane protein MurJ [Thermoanaerobaculia bacterium]|nr:murein biosynthesis integral membrane protein MurJ [Thermoanaerobaculia bacterium]